ncbi:MAG TPA: hypothetical protein VIM02_02705 [Rhizomicrobium sp.]
MPAFSFEKISPPAPRDPIQPLVSMAPNVRKPRGVIVQIMDRFVEARLRRTLRDPADADGDGPADQA